MNEITQSLAAYGGPILFTVIFVSKVVQSISIGEGDVPFEHNPILPVAPVTVKLAMYGRSTGDVYELFGAAFREERRVV